MYDYFFNYEEGIARQIYLKTSMNVHCKRIVGRRRILATVATLFVT